MHGGHVGTAQRCRGAGGTHHPVAIVGVPVVVTISVLISVLVGVLVGTDDLRRAVPHNGFHSGPHEVPCAVHHRAARAAAEAGH